MAQSCLGPNPGTVVRDALAPKLFDGSALSDTVHGDGVGGACRRWVAVAAVIGAGGASAALVGEFQGGAGPDGPGGVVAVAGYGALGEDGDKQVGLLVADVYEPYRGVVANESGGGEV